MALSKASILSVLIAAALLYLGIFINFSIGFFSQELIVFISAGIIFPIIYRLIVYGHFAPANIMALSGVGALVLIFRATNNIVLAGLSGLVVSIVVGLIYPG